MRGKERRKREGSMRLAGVKEYRPLKFQGMGGGGDDVHVQK